jgi:tRNA1(Val) A37 N6-methylase TrmN6
MPTLQKRNGVHFTPSELAAFVAERLAPHIDATKGNVRILDPACGDGNLLVAMAGALKTSTLRRSTLTGVEDDDDSFRAACCRMERIRAGATDLVRGDFLELVDNGTLLAPASNMPLCDAIIANPPYVRTQVLGATRAQQLAMRFHLRGRVDLYQAFLVAMTRQLRAEGVLGVIASNRFLTTRGGASIRQFLRSRFEILEIIDLGDTKLFEAAVLPALVFAKKRPSRDDIARERRRATFARIYEDVTAEATTAESATSILDVLRLPRTGTFKVGAAVFNVAAGVLETGQDDTRPWSLLTTGENEWVERVRAQATCRIADVARIRVGIKTTADAVFIRDDWDTMPKDVRPESRFLRPVLSHDDAARWQRGKKDRARRRRVLYTHEVVNGKRRAIRFDEQSAAWRYLISNRQRLESRTYVVDAGRQWYEIWVPQDPNAWRGPKIVFPDISPEPRFFLDRGGSVVDGNCYWITARDPADDDLLLLILGVANSGVMHRFHELAFPNRLYAQRRRYLTQYVSEYPLPSRVAPAARRIVESVQSLVGEALSPKARASLESRIDKSVAGAFGVKLEF